MRVSPRDSIEEALAGGSSAHEVLDLVDDAIEGAAREVDTFTLAALADRLDAVSAERGGDWQMLAIAAMRARALAKPAGEGGAVRARDAGSEAPPTPRLPGLTPSRDKAVQPAYVGFWLRTGAYLLDCVVLGTGYGLLTAIAPDLGSGLAAVVSVGLPLAYFAGMHAFVGGATVGKAALGMAVRGPDESEIGFGRAAWRAVATSVLWITLIGGFFDAFILGTDRRKRSLHDQIAGTVVVRTRGAQPAAPH